MKILYIGNYRDCNDQASFVLDNIASLATIKEIDLVCRPTTKLDSPIKHQCRFRELENKSLDNVDVVIQHVDPGMFEHKHGVLNIGIVEWGMSDFSKSTWVNSCNMMDAIWVSSRHEKTALIASGIESKKIKIISHGRRVDKYDVDPEPISLDNIGDSCVFYSIGEMDRAQNLPALLRSYYAAFDYRDNVVLILNKYSHDQTIDDVSNAIKKVVQDIKAGCHTYGDDKQYPKVLIISQDLSEEQTDGIHGAGDFFVSTNRGKSWDIHAQDAMGCGNIVIASKFAGYRDLCRHDYENICLIDGQETFCFGVTTAIQEMYDGRTRWFDPSIIDLCEKMKYFYDQWKIGSLDVVRKAHWNRARSLSCAQVGLNMQDALGA